MVGFRGLKAASSRSITPAVSAVRDPDPDFHEGQIERPIPPEAAIPLPGMSLAPRHDRRWVDCVEKLSEANSLVILDSHCAEWR